MKHLILFLLFFLSFNGLGQVVIGMPEYFIFYHGYDNYVEAGSIKHVKQITLTSPDIQFTKTEKPNTYIARTISENSSSKVYMLNTRSKDTIEVFSVILRQLPAPNLYFGGSENGGKAGKTETRLFAKYGPNIPLNVSFAIIEGAVTLENGTKIQFGGSKLSKEASDQLQAIEGDSTVTIEATVKGPDGVIRIITANFRL